MALASIQKINKIFPIDVADRIEGCEILGWKCVVRKGFFKEGDLCVYVEIDTIIPKQLLDEDYTGEDVVRLRTVKMRGQISQGLVLPLNILCKFPPNNIPLHEDDLNGVVKYIFALNSGDASNWLKVKKYEKQIPAHLQGIIKRNFPDFLRKTDEVRIQSEPKLLEELKGKPYYITTKMDGTSATYYKFEGKFGVCSRNLELQDGDNVYWNMSRKYNIESWLPEGFAIQGEICGEGIQKNPLKISGQELFIFNTYEIRTGEYVIPDILYRFYHQLGLKNVPVEENKGNFNYTLEELLEKAKGNYSSGNRKEGIVIRGTDQTISFKVINNDYLLKDEE